MKLFFLFSFLIFSLVSEGQPVGSVFQSQISRTPFLNWEYVYPDSSSAYQDTIEGIQRYFWSKKGEVNTQNIIYAYDYQSVIDGTLARDLYRDWNSFELDSVYAHGMFYQDNPDIGDAVNRFTDTILGSAWNEDYLEGDRIVTFEEVFMRKDFDFEPPLIVISYMKETVDTADYIPDTESDEGWVNDVNFDFSGSWIGRVNRYTFNIPQDSFTSMQFQDSMLQVYFKPLDSVTYQMLPDTVWQQGYDWKTTLNFTGENWKVKAEYFNPDWSDSNFLLSDQPDSIYFLVVVDPIQIKEYEMELDENEEFGWIWLFYRINAIKEE